MVYNDIKAPVSRGNELKAHAYLFSQFMNSYVSNRHPHIRQGIKALNQIS